MVLLSIAAAVITVTLIVLACVMIPAFLELRKTAVAVRQFATFMEIELKPLMHDMRDTLTDLKVITEEAATRADDVKIFMEELGNAGRTIRTVNNVIGGITGFVAGSSLWLTGAKVAGKLITDKLLKKRG